MKIKDYLHVFNITQEQFAIKMKSTQGLINAYISGKRRPTMDSVRRIIVTSNGMVGFEDLYPEVVETEKCSRELWTESDFKLYDCYKTIGRII